MRILRTSTLLFPVFALSSLALVASFAACVSDDSSGNTVADAEADTFVAKPGEDGGGAKADTGAPVDDAGDASVAVDAGPVTFCTTQAKPAGSTDFLCADFDGEKIDDGFTALTYFTAPDAGPKTLSLTQTAFLSSPNSLLSVPPGGAGFSRRGGVLEWDKVGAKVVTEIKMDFSLNRAPRGGVVAPATGSVVVVKLGGTDSTVAFSWADGANVGANNNYTGYFLDQTYAGAGAIRNTVAIPAPVDNIWTKVTLTYKSNGAFRVLYDDVQVYDGSAIAYTGTTASVEVGAYTSGQTAFAHNYRIDNVVAAAFRAP